MRTPTQTQTQTQTPAPAGPVRVLDERSLSHIRQADLQLSLGLTVLSNESSVTFCHVQSNVAAALPNVVARKIALHEVAAEVQEKEYDVDYSLLTLRKIASSQHFSGLKAQVQRAQAILADATSLAPTPVLPGRFEVPPPAPMDIPHQAPRRSAEFPHSTIGTGSSASTGAASLDADAGSGSLPGVSRTSGRAAGSEGIMVPVKKKKAKRRKIETFELKPKAF